MKIEPFEMPRSAEAEVSVLGTIMSQSSDMLDRAMELLNPDHFYTRSHKIIYEAFLEMTSLGQPVDTITVTTFLMAKGKCEEVGGAFYISKIGISTSFHFEHLCQVLIEKLRLRKIVELVEEFKVKAFQSEDSKEIIPSMESRLFSISSDVSVDENLTHSAVMDLENQVKLRMDGGSVFGVSSGIPSFDKVTGGLMPGRYYALAALQKVGKTALGCQIALNVLLSGKPVLFISLELSADRLLARMACTLSGTSYFKFLKNAMDKQDLIKFKHAFQKIGRTPFFIERSFDMTGAKIRSLIRKHKRKNAIELVVIDYIQNVSITGGDVRRSVADASVSIRSACGETGVPAVTICQLNRSAAKERPRMYHLRESSQIESDADTIIILFPKVEKDTLPQDALVPMVMAFDANRDGPTCDQELLYDGSCYKFKELERTY